MVVVGAGKTLVVFLGRKVVYRFHRVFATTIIIGSKLLEYLVRRRSLVVVLLLQIPQESKARMEPGRGQLVNCFGVLLVKVYFF